MGQADHRQCSGSSDIHIFNDLEGNCSSKHGRKEKIYREARDHQREGTKREQVFSNYTIINNL